MQVGGECWHTLAAGRRWAACMTVRQTCGSCRCATHRWACVGATASTPRCLLPRPARPPPPAARRAALLRPSKRSSNGRSSSPSSSLLLHSASGSSAASSRQQGLQGISSSSSNSGISCSWNSSPRQAGGCQSALRLQMQHMFAMQHASEPSPESPQRSWVESSLPLGESAACRTRRWPPALAPRRPAAATRPLAGCPCRGRCAGAAAALPLAPPPLQGGGQVP